jgi:serine/threonine protein kinase
VLLLQEKRISVVYAKKLLRLIESTVKTETTKEMIEQGYLFDGFLGAVGNGKAMFYHVLDLRTGEVGCAKVYTAADSELALKESDVSKHLHTPAKCPLIVCYKDPLAFTHHHQTDVRMLALIMPLYAQSLQSFLDALYEKQFPDLLSVRLGFTLIKIGQVLEQKQICHADIKPSNIMFDTLGNMVLIDLGAAVKYGKPIVEHTPYFGMDAPKIGSARYDLNSIATTLLQCAYPTHNAQKPWKCNDMLTKYQGATHLGAQLAVICLRSESFAGVTDGVLEWLTRQEKPVQDVVATLL